MPASLRGATLHAVLIDLDDTILDNRSGWAAAWNEVVRFTRETYPQLDPEALLRACREAADWFWGDAERHRTGRLDLERARTHIIARALEALGSPDPPLAAAAARRHSEFRETSYRLEPGALDALERLRAAVPRLALVTNGASRPQRAKIERFGLARFFDHIQVEGEFGAGKPDARVFGHAIERVGARPSESLMVGDDFARDVEGAIAAGLRAAWIDVEGGARAAERARAHSVVRSFPELVALLGCS